MSKIKIKKYNHDEQVAILPDGHFIHDPVDYINDKKYFKYSGENTNISIIGTGVPFHRDFINIEEYANFSQDKITEDTHGLSVQIGGIVGANNPEEGIIGLAFSSNMYFAKALDSSGLGDLNSLNASILWSLVKNSDLIVIPFDVPVINEALAATIRKVREQKISILYFGNKSKNIIEGAYVFDKRKRYNTWTTSTGVSNYIKPSFKISSMGIASGIMALVIDKFKKSKKDFIPEKVYAEFERIL